MQRSHDSGMRSAHHVRVESRLEGPVKFVSAEQFVEGLIAALSLQGKQMIDLHNPDLDRQFAKAYDDLLDNAEALGLVPDFVISPDPDFGDSTCLRDAILAVRDYRSVALNNPRFVKLTIRLNERSAQEVLSTGIFPPALLEGMAARHLDHVAA